VYSASVTTFISSNNNNQTVDSQNYWLSGVNCEKIYGEYIEPADGEC